MSRSSPESSAHTIDSNMSSLSSVKSQNKNQWNQEIILTPMELAFIADMKKKYDAIQKREELISNIHKKISDTVKNIITNVTPIAQKFWENFVLKAKKNRHNLEDSIMAAMQPKLAQDIDNEIKRAQMLAELEVAIFDDAFNYFNPVNDSMDMEQENRYITRTNIEKYIVNNPNNPIITTPIGDLIQSAFKLHGANYVVNESQKIMYIVQILCDDIMVYTNTTPTKNAIDKAIAECIYKSSSDIMSETTSDKNYAKSRGIGGPERLIHNPQTDRWYIVNRNGIRKRIINPKKYGLPTTQRKKKPSKSTRKYKGPFTK